MNLPIVSFDDSNGIMVRGQYLDNGDWVNYHIKKDLDDFDEMMKWIMSDMGYSDVEIDDNVKEWFDRCIKIKTQSKRKF